MSANVTTIINTVFHFIGDQHWEMMSGTDCAVQYLANVVAQYYFRLKKMPSFSDSAVTKESFEKLFPNSADAHIKNHFKKIYKDVIALLQKEKKRHGLTTCFISTCFISTSFLKSLGYRC